MVDPVQPPAPPKEISMERAMALGIMCGFVSCLLLWRTSQARKQLIAWIDEQVVRVTVPDDLSDLEP